MNKRDKTNNLSIISFAIKRIIASDKLFTFPGVITMTVGRLSAAIYGGIPLIKTGWIFRALILFFYPPLHFSKKVAPLQNKIP